MSELPSQRLSQAIQAEVLRFEEFYHWLEKNMPDVFFKEVNIEWIPLIVHSLMGFKEQDFFALIHLKNAAIALCINDPHADVKILKNFPLYGIKNYTTYVSKEPLPYEGSPGFLKIATLEFTEAFDKEEIDDRFLGKMTKDMQTLALKMFERAKERDLCQYEVIYEKNWQTLKVPSTQIVLAWKNVPKHNFLYRLARVVERHGLVMKGVNATYFHPYEVDSIFMLAFGLDGADGNAASESADLADFLQELISLKYFGSEDPIDATFVQKGLVSGNMGNFLRTCINFIHQVLVHVDQNLYSLEHIEEGICRHPELTIKLCEAFELKFHPKYHDLAKFAKMHALFIQLVSHIDTGHEYHDIRRKNILFQAMNFVAHTLKTNFYKTNKSAFSFRLDPQYLEHAPFERKKVFPELPFGIFFIKGMHFIAFHIRFKDLARGGLRTILPRRKERMLAEWNTVFTECYNLALTQQKKNKDIPEGGSKAVIFLKPYEHLALEAAILGQELESAHLPKKKIEEKIEAFSKAQELEYLYQTQRSFIKNLLILINCERDGSLRSKDIIDYYKLPEYIYLGPDENMHDVMIEWIAAESKKEHYRPGGAFISGKPKIGINHKEFGVTSLGVNVYMQEVLNYLNINPLIDTFTVKMTGGPDGDVAGNQILNLYRFYPKTAKLVALTDVSGTINDPEGLDLKILADMFHKGLSIRFYPPEKLSNGSFLLDRETKREKTSLLQQTLCWRKVDGILVEDWASGNEMNALFRNNVHHTYADIFIPCGGRPRTLRDTNYQDFLDPTGAPTSKAIIEGANLYLTPWARHYLEEADVLIIIDSSANKGGVICSSFEILCSLCLTDEEFLKYKPTLVVEILERLKRCARLEAELLLSEHEKTKKPLTEISDEISKRINYFTDQLLSYLETITLPENPNDPLNKCFLDYCLKALRDKFQDRLLHQIPENHKKAIIASHIASSLVYTRGLSWFPSLIDILPLLLKI